MYRYFSGIVASLMCIVSASPALSAQTPTHAKLTVEDLHPGSAACGVTEPKIRSALRAAMRYNRISEDDADATGVPIIYVNILTMMDGDACVSHHSIVLQAWTAAVVDYESGGPIYGFLALGSGGGLSATAANSFEHWEKVENSLKSDLEDALSYAAENHKMSKVLW